MKNKKKIILKKVLISILVIVLVICLPMIHLYKSEDNNLIYKTFIGNKSEFQGIIEIWNIDSFEGGTALKSTYLSNRAREFEKQNKGLFFLIRNISESECKNMLKSGQKPDLFSCSYGVSREIKEFIDSFCDYKNETMYTNFLYGGKDESGQQYGIPWCFGVYSLISTKSKLEQAGVYSENLNLKTVALSSAYEYRSNKKTLISYSLTFGTNKYLMPQNALLSYNIKGIAQTNNNELDLESLGQTQYSAYTRLLSNNATILLGTQRDIQRMLNREKQGKVTDVLICPLFKFTDLVQFMFIAKTDNFEKRNAAERYVQYITNSSSQSKLDEIGMFSVLSDVNMSYIGIMKDIASNNFSNCRLFYVFDEPYLF